MSTKDTTKMGEEIAKGFMQGIERSVKSNRIKRIEKKSAELALTGASTAGVFTLGICSMAQDDWIAGVIGLLLTCTGVWSYKVTKRELNSAIESLGDLVK